MSNTSVSQTYENLKKLHHWADKSLIEDILDHVDNNLDEASNLLKQMVPTDCFEKNKDTSFLGWECDSKDILVNYDKLGENNGIAMDERKNFDEKHLIEDIMAAVNNDFDAASTLLKEMVSPDCVEKKEIDYEDFLFDSNALEDGVYYGENVMGDRVYGGKMFGDHGGFMEHVLGKLKLTPVKSEREDDDICISHRKDAMRMMRSASHHSKSAKDAYLRRDHVSAQHFSLKAKQEFEVAKRLNAEAAKQILSINNSKNDMWTLDLNGLHLDEAIEALREHLQRVESQGINLVTVPNITCMLQVITGRVNHSKGEARLLVAIRSFLTENRYHYDEARPGVIMLRPKFCQVSKDIEMPKDEPNTVLQTYEKLKTLHPWAEKLLIEEIMAVVNDDIDEASVLLKGMISDDCFGKNKKTRYEEPFQLGDIDELPIIIETNKPNVVFQGYEKLKKLHPWADKSLIEEIMSFVNDDTDEATNLLASMDSDDVYEKKKEICIVDLEIDKPNAVLPTYEKLKKIHPWADKSLIEEIMEAVNNDLDEASHLLASMASSDVYEKKKEICIVDLEMDEPNAVLQTYGKLKKLHPWADKSLIEEIMEAVNNDIDLASILLKEMASDDSIEKNIGACFGDSASGGNDDNGLAGGLIYDKGLIDGHPFGGKVLCDHGGLTEPEWEDDDFYSRFISVEPEREKGDIYLIHRRDAMRMNSLASQHSKAAKEAYKTKDHVSAQHFSLKAKQEWEVAKRLNAEAAKQILMIKNRKHDMWTLDLHGLHVAEAVEAVQAHLHKIEYQGPLYYNDKRDITGFESLEALNCLYMEKLDKQPPSSGPRLLNVITGRGIHSKGEAPLPVAVRSFLTANGYHYDEVRLGVITVRPKFRCS